MFSSACVLNDKLFWRLSSTPTLTRQFTISHSGFSVYNFEVFGAVVSEKKRLEKIVDDADCRRRRRRVMPIAYGLSASKLKIKSQETHIILHLKSRTRFDFWLADNTLVTAYTTCSRSHIFPRSTLTAINMKDDDSCVLNFNKISIPK